VHAFWYSRYEARGYSIRYTGRHEHEDIIERGGTYEEVPIHQRRSHPEDDAAESTSFVCPVSIRIPKVEIRTRGVD